MDESLSQYESETSQYIKIEAASSGEIFSILALALISPFLILGNLDGFVNSPILALCLI